jgi:cytochrome c
MRASYLIPAAFAALFCLAACDGNNEGAPASGTPAIPAPTLDQLPPPYNAADLEHGKSVFAKCKNCHSLIAAEGHKVGPNLHGVFDRHPASATKFKYSPALKAFTEERWTPELVDHWLSNPGTFLPGNGMFFNGIGKPDDRRDAIAYLLINTRK